MSATRVPIVSDLNNPNPCISSTVPREVYWSFEMLAASKRMSKSAYLRELIIEHVAEQGLK